MDLKKIAEDLRNVIAQKQAEASLTFTEDTHTYFIKDTNGNITSDLPSISTVLKAFYTPFNSVETASFKNCNGDIELEKELLSKWKESAEYSTNKGSRVHYELEKELISQYGNYKNVRMPIFNCDEKQTIEGDQMILAGKKFIDLMHQRGAVLIDTEIVLGSAELGIVGQPDKMWLMLDKDKNLGFVVTDWKSNKKENMSEEKKPWTKSMLSPFEFLNDNALGHYKLQLPFYAKIFLKMLEGSKYGNIKFFGCVIVHLTDEGDFKEYRVEKNIINLVIDMDIKKTLQERKEHIKEHKYFAQRDLDIINS